MNIGFCMIRSVVLSVFTVMMVILCQPMPAGAEPQSPSADNSSKGKVPHDNYFVFQSFTLGNAQEQLTSFTTSGSLAVLKTPHSDMTDYELWIQGMSSLSSDNKNKESTLGPIRFTRNTASEKVAFSTKGFGLAEAVINQIIAQVEKNPRSAGTWDQEVSLDLLKSHLPSKLAFHSHVQKIELKPGVQALLIRTYSDVFKIDIVPATTSAPTDYFSGMYKGVLVYSPEDHRLYQMASEFDARKGEETLQVQETSFLAGLDGKPVFPLLDMRGLLELQKPNKTDPLVSIPRWAGQALKVQQTVSLACATTAERASNPAILPIIAQIAEIDGFMGLAGLPSSSSLIESIGNLYGGQEGQLAGRFFATVGSEALGAALPETALATAVPVIPALVTATSVYTMYTIAAEVATYAWAADLAKIEPFRWPQCAPMECLAQANAAFDLDKPLQPTPEPGPIPEPPSGKGLSLGKKIGIGAAVVTGVAAGVAGAAAIADAAEEDDVATDTGGNGACSASTCCTTSGGVQVVGIPVPTSCGGCPSGTTYSYTDNTTPGGPYYFCTCDACN